MTTVELMVARFATFDAWLGGIHSRPLLWARYRVVRVDFKSFFPPPNQYNNNDTTTTNDDCDDCDDCDDECNDECNDDCVCVHNNVVLNINTPSI